MHVIQPKRIGRETSHRGGLLMVLPCRARAIGNVAIIICQIGGNGQPKVKGCGCPGPAGIFPLGFTREAIVSASLLAEFLALLNPMIAELPDLPVSVQLSLGVST
jgi:hypothetical protein